jgi:hypothetical protein
LSGSSGGGTNIAGVGHKWWWSDNVLTIQVESWLIHRGQTRGSRHQEIWSVAADDRLTIVVKDQQDAASVTTTRFVYRRRP